MISDRERQLDQENALLRARIAQLEDLLPTAADSEGGRTHVGRDAESQSNELLRAIMDNIPVLLCIWDPALKSFRINREMTRVLGWTDSDAADGDFMMKVYPDPAYRRQVIEYMQSLEPGWRDLDCAAKNGNPVPISWANVRLAGDQQIGIGIDLRPLRKTAEELRASEARFRAIFDHARDSIILSDPEGSGRVLSVNPAACRLFGYTEEEFRNLPRTALLDQDDRRVAQLLARRTRDGEATAELPYLRRDGTRFTGEVTTALFVNASGQRRSVAIIRDISERKRSEERLRAGEQRYRNLFENMSEGCFLAEIICDASARPVDYRYIDANAAFEPLTGLRTAEIIGKTVREVVPGVEDIWIETYGRVAMTGNPEQLEHHAMPLGRHYWTSAYSPGPGLFACLFQDVTERRRIEAALRETDMSYRALFDNSINGLAHCEVVMGSGDRPADYRFIEVNNAFAKFTGLARESVIGRTAREVIPGIENSQVDIIGIHAEVALTGKETTFEMFQEHFRRWYSVFVFSPKKGQFVSIFSDITERKRAEEALRAANEKLIMADRHKNEFLAMLSHELRNPLAAISNAIELLKLRGPADPVLQRAREVALRQTSHMAHLLDDLLDVARVTQGKVVLNRTDVSLHSIVEMAVETSNHYMRERVHTLFVSHPREPMTVYGDPVRLSQVLGNLLHNAAKYTPPGGEIYLTVEREGHDAVIEVRDNGNGIDPNLLPHVFDLFVQGARSSDRSEGGLGIGLTLVRSLVELHGGRVHARSEGLGRGSEFRIALPLMTAVQEQYADTRAGEAEESSPLNVVVVDDQADSAEMLALLLETEGHHVNVVHSGLQAVNLCLAEIPDVALVDIGMPDMDGYEVARALRDSATLSRLALIAVSGYGQTEDVQGSREAGFDEHVTKPVDFAILKQTIRDVVRKRRGKGVKG